MCKNYSVTALSQTYYEAEKQLRYRIEELKILKSDLHGDSLKRVQERILSLVSDARLCRKTAQYLEKYYEKGDVK